MSVEALTADGWKIALATATGPATTVSVPATSPADVDITLAANPARIVEVLGLRSLTGLPSGVVLVGVSYPALNTVRIRVYNTTGSAVNITAGSVSATVVCKAT